MPKPNPSPPPSNSSQTAQPPKREFIAASAAPDWASLVWCDLRNIYIQLPGPDGKPCVISYPRTAVGLSAALGIFITRHEKEGVAGAIFNTSTTKPTVARDPRFSQDQREGVRDILKKAGVIG